MIEFCGEKEREANGISRKLGRCIKDGKTGVVCMGGGGTYRVRSKIKEFFDFLKGRWRDFGRYIGAEYGEGYNVTRPVGIDDLTNLL